MAKYCADCYNMDSCPNNNGTFRCLNSRKSGYDEVAANMIACSSFGEIFNSRRSEREREELMRISKSHGYFIVTVICDIIGLKRDNIYRDTFAYIKDELMPNLIGGEEFVNDYNANGPKIATALLDDRNREEKASKLFHEYLVPFVTLAKNQNIDAAIAIYQRMYDKLKIEYGIEPTPNKLTLNKDE